MTNLLFAQHFRLFYAKSPGLVSNMLHVSTRLLAACSPQTFYRHRSTPVQRYQQPIPRPLPPPKLTQGDFALLVDIYDKNLNPAMSRLITGDELRQLVEDGELTLVFKRSFCYELGRAKCFFEGCTCSVKCKFEHEHEDDNRILYNPRVFFLR